MSNRRHSNRKTRLQKLAQAIAFGVVPYPRDLIARRDRLEGQERRRMTITLAKLNAEIGKLGVAFNKHKPPEPKGRPPRPPFGLESGWRRIFRKFEIDAPSSVAGRTLPRSAIEAPELAGQVWCVGDDSDIAKPIKLETAECDAIARTLMPVETERDRIAGHNARHNTMLEAITGQTPERQEFSLQGVGDAINQADVMEMLASDVGWHAWVRRSVRDRRNDHLDDKRYPCKKLTGAALIEAKASLRPPKTGGARAPWQAPPEWCLFDRCKGANRSSGPSHRVDGNTHISTLNRVRTINVPDDWWDRNNSYADHDHLMALKSKLPIPHEWGAQPFEKPFYGTHNGKRGKIRSLVNEGDIGGHTIDESDCWIDPEEWDEPEE
jgi:hypothetical protein